MPVVPVLNADQVTRKPMTDAKFKAADFGSGGEMVGKAVQRLGAAGQEFADEQDRIYALQDEAAAKKLDNEAVERMRSLLWTGDNAFYTKEGFDAGNARASTEKAIKDLRGELIGRATSERQARMFGDVFDRRASQEYEGIARYSTAQVAHEEEKQSIARGINAATEAVTYADDPVRSETAIQTGISEIRSRADKQGWAPEVRKVEEAKYVSGIRVGQIDQKSRADPVTAMALVEKYRDELLPEDEQKLRDTLYPAMMERQAVADIDAYQGVQTDVVPQAPKPGSGEAPTLAKMQAITAYSESRDREYNSDGSRVTSPKGARGVMQVMPATARDPGYGIKPSDGTPEEDARVGREKLAAMMTRYHGDTAKAWAAYNWGEGNVDKAVAAHGDAWLSAAPPETKAYVASNTAALGGGQPGVGRYSPRQDDLAGIYHWIDQQPWDFERKQQARAEADRRVARNDMLLRRQEQAALDDAYRTITPLGDGFTSINQLPPEVRRRLSPEALNRLTEQARANATPKPIAANGDTTLALSLMKTYEPEKFAQTDLRLYRDKMTPAEFKDLADTQAAMRANPKAPIAVSHDAIWGTINKYGPDVGIDPKKIGKEKSEDRKDAMRVFGMMKSDLDGITQGKRQPTDDEVKAAWDRAVLSVKQPGRFFGERQLPRFRVGEGEGYRVDVPNDVRDRIVGSFRRREGRPPNESEVAQTYMRFKGQAGFWP